METITSLDKISFDFLFDAFSGAFDDYEVQISKDEFQMMLSRRGFVPELSFGAFDKDQLVSFTLNGIGMFNGRKTAYDTGTGTVKGYRGKGLATEVFSYSIPKLKKAGITQYVLEVLQHNTPAISVYKNLGFEVSREFNYFVQQRDEIKHGLRPVHAKYELKRIGLGLKEQMAGFHDFAPSWQNSFESIARRTSDFIMLGAFDGTTLVGYCIFAPDTGDITQIAVDKNYRLQGIASSLIDEVAKENKHQNIKLINAEVGCDSIKYFIESLGIHLRGNQFEMIRQF
jgi:ribosomal protein S18 acetylase RimI-like enzyme